MIYMLRESGHLNKEYIYNLFLEDPLKISIHSFINMLESIVVKHNRRTQVFPYIKHNRRRIVFPQLENETSFSLNFTNRNIIFSF